MTCELIFSFCLRWRSVLLPHCWSISECLPFIRPEITVAQEHSYFIYFFCTQEAVTADCSYFVFLTRSRIAECYAQWFCMYSCSVWWPRKSRPILSSFSVSLFSRSLKCIISSFGRPDLKCCQIGWEQLSSVRFVGASILFCFFVMTCCRIVYV